MTALAEIGKSHMTVAALRGSDLAEFNEVHPRDEAGRFAAKASAPAMQDPRVQRAARMARRSRLMRRANTSLSNMEAIAREEQEAQADPRALQALHRPRIADRRQADPRQRQRAVVQQTPEEKKATVDLNDPSKMDLDEPAIAVTSTAWVVLDPEQAMELMAAKSFNVGAAQERWGTTLTAYTKAELRQFATDNPGLLDSKVLMKFDHHWFTNEGEGTRGHESGQTLATAQYISVDLNFAEDLEQIRTQETFITGVPGEPGQHAVIRVPVITVNSDDVELAPWLLQHYPAFKDDAGGKEPAFQPEVKTAYDKPLKKSFSKAAAWEAEEHPRNTKGQFASRPATPIIDPRAARTQRQGRLQRRRRAIAQSATQTEVMPATERVLATRNNERVASRQQNAELLALRERRSSRSKDTGSPGRSNLRHTEEDFAPAIPPKPPRKGRLVYGDVGAGGRSVTPEEWAAIQRGTSEHVTSRTPSRSLSSIKRKASSDRLTAPEAVDRITALPKPRFLWDEETGELLNEEEIKAWAAAKRAARTRKAQRSTS